jgi:hypothetical protein
MPIIVIVLLIYHRHKHTDPRCRSWRRGGGNLQPTSQYTVLLLLRFLSQETRIPVLGQVYTPILIIAAFKMQNANADAIQLFYLWIALIRSDFKFTASAKGTRLTSPQHSVVGFIILSEYTSLSICCVNACELGWLRFTSYYNIRDISWPLSPEWMDRCNWILFYYYVLHKPSSKQIAIII